VYWSPETEAAIQKLGAAVDFKTIWVAEKCCDCALYAWVRKVFEVRKELGKGTKGYSLKLALNSLYGKLAERIGGDGPYHDIVAAGLITAITRARLIDAIALDPAAIVMVAAFHARAARTCAIGRRARRLGTEGARPDVRCSTRSVFLS